MNNTTIITPPPNYIAEAGGVFTGFAGIAALAVAASKYWNRKSRSRTQNRRNVEKGAESEKPIVEENVEQVTNLDTAIMPDHVGVDVSQPLDQNVESPQPQLSIPIVSIEEKKPTETMKLVSRPQLSQAAVSLKTSKTGKKAKNSALNQPVVLAIAKLSTRKNKKAVENIQVIAMKPKGKENVPIFGKKLTVIKIKEKENVPIVAKKLTATKSHDKPVVIAKAKKAQAHERIQKMAEEKAGQHLEPEIEVKEIKEEVKVPCEDELKESDAETVESCEAETKNSDEEVNEPREEETMQIDEEDIGQMDDLEYDSMSDTSSLQEDPMPENTCRDMVHGSLTDLEERQYAAKQISYYVEGQLREIDEVTEDQSSKSLEIFSQLHHLALNWKDLVEFDGYTEEIYYEQAAKAWVQPLALCKEVAKKVLDMRFRILSNSRPQDFDPIRTPRYYQSLETKILEGLDTEIREVWIHKTTDPFVIKMIEKILEAAREESLVWQSTYTALESELKAMGISQGIATPAEALQLLGFYAQCTEDGNVNGEPIFYPAAELIRHDIKKQIQLKIIKDIKREFKKGGVEALQKARANKNSPLDFLWPSLLAAVTKCRADGDVQWARLIHDALEEGEYENKFDTQKWTTLLQMLRDQEPVEV